MRLGNKLVEQVTIDGSIVEDYDRILSTSEIESVLSQYLPGVRKSITSPAFYITEYRGIRFAIRCKNITYLGNPHPTYKKRIQIADDLKHFHSNALNLGCIPLLFGIYTYKNNTLLVNFGLDTYIHKSAHNSSAHIYSSDLAEASQLGFSEKYDYFGNTITAFKPKHIDVFLNETISMINGEKEDYSLIYGRSNDDATSRLQAYTYRFQKLIFPTINNYFSHLETRWNGIACYKEMMAANYKNMYQSEWAGFYMEYRFEKYLKANNLESIIQYYQDKRNNGIDLDLYFPPMNAFGDLKTHSEDSSGIQGNDLETVLSLINNEEIGHIYYIVCEHSTDKDFNHNYEVTYFWNTALHKIDLTSYGKKMKNNVTLRKAYVLDINSSNQKYLTLFKQGINSNGKPRAPKIMINNNNLEHFIINEIKLIER